MFLFLKTALHNSFLKHKEHHFGVLRELLLFFEFSIFYVLYVFNNKKQLETKDVLIFLTLDNRKQFSKIETKLA